MRKTSWTLAAALLAGALGGCASDGDSTLTLNLFDAPPAGVTSVVIQVASVQVHVDDKSKTSSADGSDSKLDSDGKWQTLAVNQAINLVQHQGDGGAVGLGNLTLPAGKITQMRLMLDATKKNTVKVGDKTCDLDLSKVKNGLKINHVFKALDTSLESRHEAWLDVQLDKVLEATKDCYALKPELRLHKFMSGGTEIKL